MGPILIVGIDGTIGSALARVLRQQGRQVVGTTRRPVAPHSASIALDLSDPRCADRELPHVAAAYFCAAITRMADCRRDEPLARQVNVVAPLLLARRLVADGTRVVLLSSNAVFDGSSARTDGAQAPRPLSVYGRLKAEAEAGFSALGEPASILRLSKVLPPDAPLLRSWVAVLGRGEPVRAFRDHHLAPISLDLAVAALAALAEPPARGIYQLSATHDISYYAAAQRLAIRMRRDPALVTATSARDAGIDPSEITSFSSLDCSRLTALTGLEPPDPFEVIERFAEPGSA